MEVKKVTVQEAIGDILLHHHIGEDGRKVLSKGRVISAEDVATLQKHGVSEVYVAVLAADDVAEDEAARRIGAVISGGAVGVTKASTGRVNLLAEAPGLFKVDVAGLAALNQIAGVTLATLTTNTVVKPKQVLATLKIIPYAVPQAALTTAKQVARQHQPLITIKPFAMQQAMLITTGSEAARAKVINSFTPVLRERLAAYNVQLTAGPYLPEEETAISEAIQIAITQGMELILLAGESSIMDAYDIIPQAIRAAGGTVIHHGVAVEPGNLLLMAYHGETPIVGAPGCARSKKVNVVDLLLPRLAAGERITQHDLVALGHGGYLK